MKYNLKDTSFLFTVRIDSIERFENLRTVIEYISSSFETNITVLEADRLNNSLLRDWIGWGGVLAAGVASAAIGFYTAGK